PLPRRLLLRSRNLRSRWCRQRTQSPWKRPEAAKPYASKRAPHLQRAWANGDIGQHDGLAMTSHVDRSRAAIARAEKNDANRCADHRETQPEIGHRLVGSTLVDVVLLAEGATVVRACSLEIAVDRLIQCSEGNEGEEPGAARSECDVGPRPIDWRRRGARRL